MRAGTYPARDYATFGRSELPPTFTGGLIQSAILRKERRTTAEFDTPALVRPRPLYILLRVKQGPVFLINSRQENFRCGPVKLGRSYPEVTTTFLPSSLTRFHPFTWAQLRQPTCVGFAVRIEHIINS